MILIAYINKLSPFRIQIILTPARLYTASQNCIRSFSGRSTNVGSCDRFKHFNGFPASIGSQCTIDSLASALGFPVLAKEVK